MTSPFPGKFTGRQVELHGHFKCRSSEWTAINPGPNTSKISSCVCIDCALHQPAHVRCCCAICDPEQSCFTMFSLLKVLPSAGAAELWVCASGKDTLVHVSWAELEKLHGLSHQLQLTITAQVVANIEHSQAHCGQTTLES